jgi:hypothetical protein
VAAGGSPTSSADGGSSCSGSSYSRSPRHSARWRRRRTRSSRFASCSARIGAARAVVAGPRVEAFPASAARTRWPCRPRWGRSPRHRAVARRPAHHRVGLALVFLVNVPVGAARLRAGTPAPRRESRAGRRRLPDSRVRCCSRSRRRPGPRRGQAMEWGWSRPGDPRASSRRRRPRRAVTWRSSWHRSPIVDLNLLRIRSFTPPTRCRCWPRRALPATPSPTSVPHGVWAIRCSRPAWPSRRPVRRGGCRRPRERRPSATGIRIGS